MVQNLRFLTAKSWGTRPPVPFVIGFISTHLSMSAPFAGQQFCFLAAVWLQKHLHGHHSQLEAAPQLLCQGVNVILELIIPTVLKFA
mmetsp:Transcript_109794/g.218058  ORF Transcript_109794/g.218058 Transcript_109794/m.218058 type:complete len:87 (-) Transcript_109794:812-1072(-)